MKLALRAVLFILLGVAAAGLRAGAASPETREIFYAATGPELAYYSVNAAEATLTREGSAALPFAVGTDLVTIGSVALLLISVAALACFIPARRASRLDPMEALRCE